MITRDELLASIIHECNICQHLYSKIPADGFDFRPTPGQRSTTELLRYLSIVGIASIRSMVTGSWDAWGEFTARAREMSHEEFPAAMERQIEEIREAFASLSDEDFTNMEVSHPAGEKMSLAYGMMRMPIYWLVAYRMQLFLYAKQAGTHDIGTSNNWSGFDWRPESIKEEAVEAEAESDEATADAENAA